MSKQLFARPEPKLVDQRRLAGCNASESQPKKAGLESIAASELLVLATAIAQAVVGGLEMRERRKDRQILYLAAVALSFLIGLGRLALALMKH